MIWLICMSYICMCLCVKCPQWTSILNGIVSKLFQTGQWIHGINLQVDASCKMWGCVAHVCNRSWLSVVEYIVPFCSSFPKPCKIQCLVSDAKKTVVISVGCLTWNWDNSRKVHRRWDGLDELNDRFKFADFTAVFLLQQKAAGDAEHFKGLWGDSEFWFAVLQMFSAQET